MKKDLVCKKNKLNIIEGSGCGRTNPLLNMLYPEPDIDKYRYQ